MANFYYEIQTETSVPMQGIMSATSLEVAQEILGSLHVRILRLQESKESRVPEKRPLSALDFYSFNQQLAYLTSSGMPVEEGLRLIGSDLKSGRLKNTIQAVVEEMNKGASMEEAFSRHQMRFPPLYSRVVAAGVKANNLPGLLLNMGRHLELIRELREGIIRALAYPMVLVTMFMGVLLLVALVIMPQYLEIIADFKADLPVISWLVLKYGAIASYVLAGGMMVFFLIPCWFPILRRLGIKISASDVLLQVPIISPLVRRNLLARWCDALKLGVEAGLPLPEALELAGDAVDSRELRRESKMVAERVGAGHPLYSARDYAYAILPCTLLSSMQFGTTQNDLPNLLGNLSEMYQQQARQQASVIPTVLNFIAMSVIAFIFALLISAMFLPLINLIQSVTG